MKTDTGGPAFPEAGEKGDRGEYYVEYTPGATLLDYFAGQAMKGILSNPTEMKRLDDHGMTVSGQAYGEAIMMIAEKRRLEQ